MKTSGYNIMRDDIALLEVHEKHPPSFSVNLYPDYWTLNHGPKFSYNNSVSSILEDIRAFRIPTDFIKVFDEAGIQYYNGCLIVELLDFRPARAKEPVLEKPDKQRVVLRPNAETIWADICNMNEKTGSKWSDMDALLVESKILLCTSAPLCLDPDPSLTRVVNSILRVSTPNVPNSLKRKATAMVDIEEDETEKAKRAKIMQFMNPQFGNTHKPFHPSYKILAVMEQKRAAAASQQTSQPATTATVPNNISSGTMAPQNLTRQQAPEKPSVPVAPVAPTLTTSYSQSNTNTIPQPAPTTVPQMQAPPAIDPVHRQSPSKQQQSANQPVPQRPPSQAAAAPQASAVGQPPQAQAPQPTQPTQFNPPLPPANFLNPALPSGRRRPSTVVKPSTPAVATSSLPTQQPVNQSQPQTQTQIPTQTPVQSQPQTQPQPASQTQLQPASQPQPQQPAPQPITHPAQVQPPAQPRLAQIPANMAQNMAQFYQTRPPMAMTQAAAATIAAQRQAQSGRNTPVAVNNPSSSPAPPPPSALARSPMVPPAVAAAMTSRQSTPVATNNQVMRGSPLVGNHSAVARPVAGQTPAPVQQQPQQPQQPIPGSQPMMMQPGAGANPQAVYQYHQQQQRMAMIRSLHAQAHAQAMHQAQMQQQGHASPAPQQQQNPQGGNTQTVQQTTHDQAPGTQQNFAGVQMPLNYMHVSQMGQMGQMNPLALQQQQMFWAQAQAQAQAQRSMGRGMPQVGPNGQQQMPTVPANMSLQQYQQMQGLGRGGAPPNR